MSEDARQQDRSDEGIGVPDRAEPTKPATTILAQEITTAEQQLDRPASGLLLSAISGGLDIGFGPAMMATVLAMAAVPESLGIQLLVAFVYSIGFVIVILGRSELFTEHTTLAVFPLLSGDTSFARLGRLWGLVFAGNIIGAGLFSLAAATVGTGLEIYTSADLDLLAASLTGYSWAITLGSAVAAGWMMGLVSWLVTAGRDTIGQIAIIVLVTGAIGLLGLHHSIAGSVEVLLGVFGGTTPWPAFFRFLGLATLGNAIGGVVFVAAIKFGHVTQPGPTDED